MTAALEPFTSRGDLILSRSTRDEFRKLLLPAYRSTPLTKHATASTIRQVVGTSAWGSMTSFAVVRDPIERTMSLYRYLSRIAATVDQSRLRRLWYRSPLGRSVDPRTWAGMIAYTESHSFSDFIRHPALEAAPAMREQIDSLSDSRSVVIVDRILPFRSLRRDFAALGQELGLGEITLPRTNESDPSILTEISHRDSKYLRSRFRRDYEHLGSYFSREGKS
mgnify:FL=1